jgi:aryl-alcohol dehydrogenase-like predicted oxidoreductase
MLDLARQAGVRVLDTARQYGNAEDAIGAAVHQLGVADRFCIVSKYRYQGGDPHAEVPASLQASLQKLRLKSLPFYLLHNGEYAFRRDVWAALLAERDAGRVGRLGISVSENAPSLLEQSLRWEGLDAVQVPVNVFDTQLVRTGLLAALRASGKTVFVRSVFLKGLIVLPEDRVPAALGAVIGAKRRLRELAQACGREVLEMALQYALSLAEADCILIGCETLAQLQQDLDWARAPRLSAGEMAAVADLAADLPEWITKPWRWPQ